MYDCNAAAGFVTRLPLDVVRIEFTVDSFGHRHRSTFMKDVIEIQRKLRKKKKTELAGM